MDASAQQAQDIFGSRFMHGFADDKDTGGFIPDRRMTALPIGPYRLAVEKEGFRTWAGTLTLYVGQNVTVDTTLRVGSLTDVVEVKDVAAPIETTSGVIGDVRESSQIRDLPLNGRDVGLLFGLTAGVESGAGGARVNGMKVGSLDINLDGVTKSISRAARCVRDHRDIRRGRHRRIARRTAAVRADQHPSPPVQPGDRRDRQTKNQRLR